MEETNLKKIKYEQEELAKKLELKGKIVNAMMSFKEDEDKVDGVILTVEQEKEE